MFARADMIYKVKEPLPSEYGKFKPGQILYTYLHLAAAYARELTDGMLKADIRAHRLRDRRDSRTARIRCSSR